MNVERRRVLVAGCGYVGTAIAELLAARGDEVVGVRRSSAPDRAFPGGGSIRMRPVDLADPGALAAACEGIDAAVFAAAADAATDEAYRSTYVDGLRHCIEALATARAPARRLLFTSSTGVYAQSSGEWVDEASPAEATHFTGARMLEAEQVAQGAPFPAVILRLGGIYGPGRARMVESVRGGTAELSPGKPPISNRIHRDDAAGAVVHLLDIDHPEPLYLGVDGEPADTNEVLRFVAETMGLPEPPVGAAARTRSRGSEKRCSNRRLLASGYVMAYPTFREGYGAIARED